MGGKKGENSKKAAGMARKAEVAAQKQAISDAKKAADEDRKWQQGAKSNAKKESEESKRADAARKKAERDALLAAEEASQPSKPKGAGAKSAAKKTRGTLDFSHLDAALGVSTSGSKKAAALNASGIDNALDALSLTSNSESTKIDRHPERRFKAAYAAFEARRLPEIEKEQPGLRRQQRIEIVKREFEKSEDNPFNKVNVAYDASKEEIAKVKAAEKAKIESRLAAR
ncbi:coiled-coil domain-containing protein, putative [Coccidioides posadasii C735 delta SOWgp]|uniref:Coiled-coil domain-containing protein, putative n=1 Tax=Coccidioides posadasii (strain C735) TaxID=222929 RepID=C5PAE2_COCP7|nr:coiled-coil domain-containing protein, putative [Coccidioides posadasii C735 delta SOWgp]EER26704.1 coiled-coil domain-containing protein, putative [Coccidioides posadasii C735 delta SOWgp]|eukprot:XP_003068849.1 coiled-coil domain-containing protein, putative [Coccidioides posadasii C735 delta SOWgp]